VTRTGKNLTDGATVGHYISMDGTLVDLASYRSTDYINIDGITTLKATLSTILESFWFWRIASYDVNKNFIELSLNRSYKKNGDFEEEVTLPSNAKYIRACALINSTNWNIYDKLTYNTYTIQFKDGDNPLTVYGGTLDVTSGELTVTDAHIASYDAETLPSTWISDRDVYAEGATPTTGAEVVYKLANSVTYHLTPTQIRTLVGNNNIWADTGNIIEGKYFKSLT
jgi:hypothetical protein